MGKNNNYVIVTFDLDFGAILTATGLLRWREKMNRAAKSVGYAEMQRPHKIGHFAHFGETDESPGTFKFYFQHNKLTKRDSNSLLG